MATQGTDTTAMSATQAIAAAMAAHRALATAREPHLELLRQACTRLHELGMTWRQIGDELDVDPATAWRWTRLHPPPRQP